MADREEKLRLARKKLERFQQKKKATPVSNIPEAAPSFTTVNETGQTASPNILQPQNHYIEPYSSENSYAPPQTTRQQPTNGTGLLGGFLSAVNQYVNSAIANPETMNQLGAEQDAGQSASQEYAAEFQQDANIPQPAPYHAPYEYTEDQAGYHLHPDNYDENQEPYNQQYADYNQQDAGYNQADTGYHQTTFHPNGDYHQHQIDLHNLQTDYFAPFDPLNETAHQSSSLQYQPAKPDDLVDDVQHREYPDSYYRNTGLPVAYSQSESAEFVNPTTSAQDTRLQPQNTLNSPAHNQDQPSSPQRGPNDSWYSNWMGQINQLGAPPAAPVESASVNYETFSNDGQDPPQNSFAVSQSPHTRTDTELDTLIQSIAAQNEKSSLEQAEEFSILTATNAVPPKDYLAEALSEYPQDTLHIHTSRPVSTLKTREVAVAFHHVDTNVKQTSVTTDKASSAPVHPSGPGISQLPLGKGESNVQLEKDLREKMYNLDAKERFLQTVEDQNTRVSSALKEEKELLRKRREDLDSKSLQNSKLKSELDSLQSSLSSREFAFKEERRLFAEREVELSKKERAFQSKETELSNLERRLAQGEADLKHRTSDLEKQVAFTNKENEAIASKTRLLEARSRELEGKQSLITQDQEKLALLNSKLDSQRHQLEQESQLLKQREQQLKNSVVAHETQEIQSLKQQLDTCRLELKSERSLVKQLQQRLQRSSVSGDLDGLKSELEHKMHSTNQKQAQLDQLFHQCTLKQKELHLANQSLNQERETLKMEKDLQQQKSLQLEHDRQRLTNQIERSKSTQDMNNHFPTDDQHLDHVRQRDLEMRQVHEQYQKRIHALEDQLFSVRKKSVEDLNKVSSLMSDFKSFDYSSPKIRPQTAASVKTNRSDFGDWNEPERLQLLDENQVHRIQHYVSQELKKSPSSNNNSELQELMNVILSLTNTNQTLSRQMEALGRSQVENFDRPSVSTTSQRLTALDDRFNNKNISRNRKTVAIAESNIDTASQFISRQPSRNSIRSTYTLASETPQYNHQVIPSNSYAVEEMEKRAAGMSASRVTRSRVPSGNKATSYRPTAKPQEPPRPQSSRSVATGINMSYPSHPSAIPKSTSVERLYYAKENMPYRQTSNDRLTANAGPSVMSGNDALPVVSDPRFMRRVDKIRQVVRQKLDNH